MSDVVSVKTLESALNTLVVHSRGQLHVNTRDVIQLFLDAASHLDNQLEGDDHHPPSTHDDLQKIAAIFRSLNKHL